MSLLSFTSFCIEHYAEHSGRADTEVYSLFKREKLLELIRNDYADLHGMGMEFLMHFFDQYFGVAKV